MSHFSESEKLMIINVFKYVKESWPADKYPSKQEMKDKTADILGISKLAVYRILNEYTKTETVKPAAAPKKRMSIIEKIDDFDKSCIRKIVHSFYLKGELPTAKKVLQVVNADESLPSMGLTSLKKVLKHLKFKYVKRRRNNALIDRDDIALWRIKYLINMKTFREQGRPIYYLDETWVNAGHTVGKVWEDTTVKSRKQAFLEGLSTGAKNPTSKGNRLIILHIGGEEGFVPESELVFECKGTGDYHESMNAAKFENWFKEMLPRLEPNAVVVMDNASYHTRRKEKTPVTSWNKTNIQKWLTSKKITYEPKETKVQLLEKVKGVKTEYQSYVIDEMAKEVGVEVLRLPPYHCELNPIELVWADVKGYVARNNTTFKMVDVKKLLQEALKNITPEKWKNCISHVKKEEIKLGGLDNNIDKTIDSFIINVTGETSSEESSSSDTTESDSD
ncbi:uncharacterized protein LOC125074529 [Vanessa atalanta]|uniref:uncharacterized protein LOC125074529 n=1 Tax=Vanessa atalanta TaxID=42275 RepID=UPI001FCDC1BE|nr:uncharacterized protein LOC125074529 [Vanessa atalanta]